MVWRCAAGSAKAQAAGNIYQVSNQQTLGLAEEDILKHLGFWIGASSSRSGTPGASLAPDEGEKFVDRLARSFGVLRHARLLSSSEAMNMLSHLRRACDLGCLPEALRDQGGSPPHRGSAGHVQVRHGSPLDSDGRDLRRAAVMREALRAFPRSVPVRLRRSSLPLRALVVRGGAVSAGVAPGGGALASRTSRRRRPSRAAR
jgi:protein-arginine kinase